MGALLSQMALAAKQSIPKALRDLAIIEKLAKQMPVENSFLQVEEEEVAPKNWFNLSPEDNVEGVSAEKSYSDFGTPLSEDVVVAVIDSGVDVNHEDLQGKVWINTLEIPNNGIDDDKNGYVDDVFGWNFIGGKDGMASIVEDAAVENGLRLLKGNPEAQVDADTLEMTRELVRMKKLESVLTSFGEELSLKQKIYLKELKQLITEEKDQAENALKRFLPLQEQFASNLLILKKAGLEDTSTEGILSFETEDEKAQKALTELRSFIKVGYTQARLSRIVAYYDSRVKYYLNENFNPRSIVGDDYLDLENPYYGNNDVIGPDSSHGTHVAGIIAAKRDNELGMKGVATNVKIMAIRVVPNGDERDKDVAFAIRYAVDNGAAIINMSFGKSYSPYKKVVDEAVKYAEEKGVLLVHAAGNDNQNNDVANNFPNRLMGEQLQATNWLEIGAASFKKGPKLPADFSNYGKSSVDLFAPGVDIFSTTPDNKYDTYSGTSMASPAAAGVAALVLSYVPNLSLAELRAVLVDTSRRSPRLYVYRPGTEENVLFSDLSINGSQIDAYSSIRAALDPVLRSTLL